MEKDKIDVWQERNYFVVKQNPLIRQVRFNLSTSEQKLVLYLISKIQPTDTELKPVQLTVSDYLRICGLDTTAGKTKAQIRADLKSLADRSCWITLPDGRETLFRWIEDPIIEPRSRVIELKLKQILKPYLLELHEYYTQYRLAYVLPMRSRYAIRLYELLKSCQSMPQPVIFSPDKLREIMAIPEDTYTCWSDFRRYVLDVARREINKYTDILMEYKVKTEKRRIKQVEFTITAKPKADLTATFETLRTALDHTQEVQ